MSFIKVPTLVVLSLLMAQLPSLGQEKSQPPKGNIARLGDYGRPGTACFVLSQESSSADSTTKSQLTSELYSISLPAEDITFDGKTHAATSTQASGVGTISIYYAKSGTEDMSSTAPGDVGTYDVYVEISDGTLYYGLPLTKVGTFTIYSFSTSDWAVLQSITPTLTQRGWSTPWDLSGGITAVASLPGLTLERGRVVGVNLSNQGLSGTFPTELLPFSELRTLDISHNSFSGEIGALLALATQQPTLFTNIEELNVSSNLFSGNIGACAAAFPSLRSLNASHNCISEVYPMISTGVDSLSLEAQSLDKIIEVDMTNLSVETIAQQLPTILLYNHAGQSYDKPLRLKCMASDGWSIVLSHVDDHFSFSDVSSPNAYHGQSGDTLDVDAISADGTVIDASLQMRLYFGNGDANFDGNINITDLQTTILYAFNAYNSAPFNFTAADTYNDNRINVQDVICTANILLNDNSANSAQSMRKVRGQSDEAEVCIYVENGIIYMDSTCPIAALDIVINGSAKWELPQYGFEQASTAGHLIGYSPAGLTLPIGKIKIGEVSDFGGITKCLFADASANLVVANLNSGYSEINAVENIEITNGVVYDLQGRRLNSPERGVNIVIDRNGVKKLLQRK